MEISLIIQMNECNKYTQSQAPCKIGITLHEARVSSKNKSIHAVGIADTELASVASGAGNTWTLGIKQENPYNIFLCPRTLCFSATGAISSNADLRWSIDSGARERISSPIYSIIFPLVVFIGPFPYARYLKLRNIVCCLHFLFALDGNKVKQVSEESYR